MTDFDLQIRSMLEDAQGIVPFAVEHFRAKERVYKRKQHSELPDVLGYYPPGTVFVVNAVHDSSGDIDYNTTQVVELMELESGRHVWVGLGVFPLIFDEVAVD